LQSEIEKQFWVRGDYFYWAQLFQEIFEPQKKLLGSEDAQVDRKLHPKILFIKNKIEEWKKLSKEAEDLELQIDYDEDIRDLTNLTKEGDFGFSFIFKEALSLWNFYQETEKLIKKLGIYFIYEYDLLAGKSGEGYVFLKVKDAKILEKVKVNQAKEQLEDFISESQVNLNFIRYFPFQDLSGVLYRVRSYIESVVINMLDSLIEDTQDGGSSKSFYDFLKEDFGYKFSDSSDHSNISKNVLDMLNELESIINKIGQQYKIDLDKFYAKKKLLDPFENRKKAGILSNSSKVIWREILLVLHPDKIVNEELQEQEREAALEVFKEFKDWVETKKDHLNL